METELAFNVAEFSAHWAIDILNKQFCFYLDHCRNTELLDLFTDDAYYRHGDRISTGRDEISSIFAARVACSPRTARHLQTGLLIELCSDTLAKGRSCCVTFAADAMPPILGAQPLLVADFSDDYRKCSDGRWRICRREIERIFVAAGNEGPVASKPAGAMEGCR